MKEALIAYMTHLEIYEKQNKFKTDDAARFYALITQCAEELLRTQNTKNTYTALNFEWRLVWVEKEHIYRDEATTRIRENILPWLIEAKKVMPDEWYTKNDFGPLWRCVESFCGREAVEAAEGAAAAAEEVTKSVVHQEGRMESIVHMQTLLSRMKELGSCGFTQTRGLLN